MISKDLDKTLEGPELWRRQRARNLMDCYTLGMEALVDSWERGVPSHKALDAMTRLMVEGMVTLKKDADERAFYRTAAVLCEECAEASKGTHRRSQFRIYGAIFENMSRKQG